MNQEDDQAQDQLNREESEESEGSIREETEPFEKDVEEEEASDLLEDTRVDFGGSDPHSPSAKQSQPPASVQSDEFDSSPSHQSRQSHQSNQSQQSQTSHQSKPSSQSGASHQSRPTSQSNNRGSGSHSSTSSNVRQTRQAHTDSSQGGENATPPSQPSAPGERIADRYDILGLLGSGGAGSVFRVWDRELDEVVALKMLSERLTDDQAVLQRFRREVKLARRISHPNVVRTYDLGIHDGAPFITMEYVEGESVRRHLEKSGRLSTDRTAYVMREVCRGLAAAHRADVLHRDLKPHNIMLAEDGRIALTDFGIARLTHQQRKRLNELTAQDGFVGTPAYVSPEQVRSLELDRRSDLYSLGVVAFQMLTGDLPWDRDDAMATASARVAEPAPGLPDGLRVSTAMEQLVGDLMERDPDRRPSSADEVRRRLEEMLNDTPSGMQWERGTHNTPNTGTGMGATGTGSSPRGFGSDRDHHTPQGEKALAVLPFRLRGADEEYLAEGMTEELIHELSNYESLRVRPIGTVKAIDPDADPHEAGRDLGVDVVVDGSIQSFGDKLRVRVSVVSVSSGFQMWSGKFTGTAEELFGIAEEASDEVADTLSANQQQESSPSSMQAGSAAGDLYMQARHAMHSDWHSGPLDEAISLFHEALERAPDDVRVLTGLASSYARSIFLDPSEEQEYARRAENFAQRALEVAPDWAEPHYALAIKAHYVNDAADAIQHAREAIANSPDYADAHDLLGRVLAEVGPLSQAQHHLERALELNPSLFNARLDITRVSAMLGDWEMADEYFTDVEEHEIGFGHRIRIDMWRDEPVWADVFPDNVLQESPMRPIVETMQKLSLGHEVTEEELDTAWSQADELEDGNRRQILLLQMSAEMYAKVGKLDDAMTSLERAVDAGLYDLMWLKHNPLFERLEDHANMEGLVHRVAGRVDTVEA
jgi:serine/threonine-protein kinase